MLRRRRQGEGAQLPARILRGESDGSLYDLDERRRVSIGELRDELRAGRRFRVSRHDTGASCTNEVLAEVLASGPFPGVKGAGLGVGADGALGAVLGTIGGGILDALKDNPEKTRGGLFDEKRRRRPSRRRPVDSPKESPHE